MCPPGSCRACKGHKYTSCSLMLEAGGGTGQGWFAPGSFSALQDPAWGPQPLQGSWFPVPLLPCARVPRQEGCRQLAAHQMHL